jgi:gluconokinase
LSFILAVDIGTTSTKALLVQPDGKVLLATQAFYPTYYPQQGFAEQDPFEILEAVKKVIQIGTQKFRKEIAGVSFSCAMHSLIAVDENGKPISPAIIWSDIRSHLQAKNLKESSPGNAIYEQTGTPIHPMSPLCKLLWLRENQNTIFDSASKFVSIKEFVFHNFFGIWEVDYSIASATGLFDVHKLVWSRDALETALINESKLSKCVSPYMVYSGLKSSWLTELNVSSETVFIIGASDGCLANLGTDVMRAGEMSITIGTSGAVRMTSQEFQHDPQHRLFNYRLDENYFVTGGATNNGSQLLHWFNDQFLKNKADIPSIIDNGLLVGAGADGLIFLPYVYGERAPFYNPHARGVFFGLAQHHTDHHMVCAILEGICFEIKSISEALRQNVGITTKVVASGGFTQSSKWVQLLANILCEEVYVNFTDDASALGAARMGFKALGLSHEFKTDATVQHFKPDVKLQELYQRYFLLFNELTNTLQDKFEKITTGMYEKGSK